MLRESSFSRTEIVLEVGSVLVGCALFNKLIRNYSTYSWLILEGVQLAIEKEHRLRLVLVMVREGVEALRVVEAQNDKSKGTDQLLLEGNLRELRSLHISYKY